MRTYHKIISLILILPVFILVFSFSKRSDAITLSKTVIFFAGQDSVIEASGSAYSSVFNVAIPENAAAVKKAHIEINGISYNTSGTQTIIADLKDGAVSDPRTFQIELASRVQQFNIDYDVTSIVFNTPSSYTLDLTGNATGGNFSIFSAKMILTYEYDSIQSTLLKTTEFFVGQEKSKLAPNDVITKNFSISVSESSPVLRSAFIEITGVLRGTGTGTVQAGLYDAGAPVNYKKSYAIDLGPQNTTSKFIIRHDALSDINIVNNKDYTFHFTADKAVSAWSARLYLTYEYSEQSTYPMTGYAVSSTFDTGVAKGAGFNSIYWNGSLNGGNVRLQIATSDCANGKTNPPVCDDSGTWTYLGSGCSDSTYYEQTPDAPQEIGCYTFHNNKRYFRYKVIICSDVSCIVGGSNNPQVDSVIVNWAP